jgi:hypothetical protein
MIFGSGTKHVVSKSSTLTRFDPAKIEPLFPLFRVGLNDLQQRGFLQGERESMLLIQDRGFTRTSVELCRAPSSSRRKAVGQQTSLALSGSNQAREGRLVDALAARGDEGRDTLR